MSEDQAAAVRRIVEYAQHKENCDSLRCQHSYSTDNRCLQRLESSDHDPEIWSDAHMFVGGACTCGLDDLLAVLSAPHETPKDCEQAIHHIQAGMAVLLGHEGKAWAEQAFVHLQNAGRAIVNKEASVLSAPPAEPQKELREAIAALCHAQWAGWMRYLFSRCVWERAALLIPAEWEARWRRQMETPYAGLSEAEKDSDRAEADRVITLLSPAASPTPDTTEK